MQRQKRSLRVLPPLSIKIFDDLYMDFALGFRLKCTSDNCYVVKLYDDYTDILHHTFITRCKQTYYSELKFFIRWRVQVYKNDQLLYTHTLNLKDKLVIFQFPGTALGDLLANISAVDLFQKKHQCKMIVYICKQQLIDILKDQYPNLHFTNKDCELNQECYAHYLYSIGNISQSTVSPFDFRIVGLQATNAHLLNIEEIKIEKAKLNLTAQRKIKDKYVVINTSASAEHKTWLKQNWMEVVKYLKSLGYIVYQIGLQEQLIQGCQNLIGDIHLQQRINLIKDADMFIGLSSGLSWVADSCNIPVVMICNITFPRHQFYTKYRVHAIHGCKGCIHVLTREVNKDCRNTVYYQCKHNITVKQVCNTIDDVIKDFK